MEKNVSRKEGVPHCLKSAPKREPLFIKKEGGGGGKVEGEGEGERGSGRERERVTPPQHTQVCNISRESDCDTDSFHHRFSKSLSFTYFL